MKNLRTALILVLTTLLVACATQKYAPDQAPEYVIIKDYTPFYYLGPAQARGPDATLRVNDRVKLFSREMGFSLVKLDTDERTGYIENDAMALAPPRPSPSPAASDADSSGSTKSRNKKGGAAYRGQQLNDTPLPDPKVPPPDLNIAPEEVPSGTPTATPPPEKPKFRT